MSLVDNTPTPCNPPSAPPPGAKTVLIWWYLSDPKILYPLGPAPADGLDIYLNEVHRNGGTVVGISFRDASGTPMPGLDACGNPLPPPGGGGGGGGGGAPPDPGEDDLTVDFGELFAQLQILINEIAKLTTAQPQPIDYTHCCHAIAVAIETLAKVVAKIEQVLVNQPTQGAPPIDLTALTAELKCICDALAAANTISSAIPPAISGSGQAIADAITNAKPPDLKPVVDALDRYTKIIDIKPAVIDYLVKQGFIDSNLAEAVSTADTGDWILAAFRSAGWKAVTWFMAGVGYEWNGSKWAVGGSGNIASNLLSTAMHDAISTQDFLFLPTVKEAVAALQALITPTRVGKLGEVVVDPDAFLTRAVSIIVDVFLVNYAIHLGDLLPGEAMTRLLETLTGLLGLEELRDVQIGPLVQYGPARVAEMRAKFLYRQEMPGINTLATLRGRGLLDDADYNGLEGLTGVPPQLAVQIRDAAQSGLNARMLLRLAGTGLFSNADVADELTFGGVRPASQHRLMLAAAYLGSEPQRNKFLSALERVYAAGLISDDNFIRGLESADHDTDRHDLLLRAVQLEKQIALAKEYEGAYSSEFRAGLLDAPGYQSALEVLGMQPPDVAARMFRDETHLNVTTAIQAARQARAEQRATAIAERKTAIEGYRTGSLDVAGLTAALLATGLTPVQAAAATGYQVLAAAGALRWIYGLRLPPSQATLLRQQVADLTRQREIELLTDTQYVSALQALNIPAIYIQAMRAGANAHISPKTKAILTPVTAS